MCWCWLMPSKGAGALIPFFPLLFSLSQPCPGTHLWVQLLPQVPRGWLMFPGARCQPGSESPASFGVLIEKNMGIHSETKPKSLQRCWQRDTGAVVLLCSGPGQGEVTSMARATPPWGQSPPLCPHGLVWCGCSILTAMSPRSQRQHHRSLCPLGAAPGGPLCLLGGDGSHLGTAEAGASVGAAKTQPGSCCVPMHLLLLPPATAAKNPPRWLSRGQGLLPAWATPSAVSPGPRDSSGTASASS